MIRGIKITNIHYFHIAKEEIFKERKQPRVPYLPKEDRFDEGRGRRQDAAPWGAQFLEKRIPTTANCTCRMLMRGRWHLRCNNSRTRRKAVIHELQPAALRTKGRGSLNFSKSSESLHEKCDDFVKNIFFPIVLRKNCRIISFSSPSSFQRIIRETVDDLL